MLEERQAIVARHYQRFIEQLAAEVGEPPVAGVMMLHWGKNVTYDVRVLPNAPPQAQMNLLDDMLRRLRQMGEQYKARLNTMRARGKVPTG